MARRFWFGNASQGMRIDAVRARQGFRDRPVLVVLVASTILVCLAFAAVYFGLF